MLNLLKVTKNDCKVTVGKSGGSLYALTDALKIKPTKHSVVYFELPVNGKVGLHYHPNEEESYYILNGQAEVIIDGEIYHLISGDFVYIPPDKEHQLTNSGKEPLTLLAIFSAQNAVNESVEVE